MVFLIPLNEVQIYSRCYAQNWRMTELWRSVFNFCIWNGKLVAPKVWCRELQSEFCDGLRITSRKPLEVGLDFISWCSKADYPYDRRSGNTELKSYHGYGNGQDDIWKIGETFLIDLLRCSVLWFSAINQNPLSRGGPKDDSRKSRDIQSPSQRRCELKCADSRAVTKRGLFDCDLPSLMAVY